MSQSQILGVISDLHIDNNARNLQKGETFEVLLANLLIEREVDTLLMAGDVSNNYLKTQAFIEEVEDRSGVEILFVPGNHDFWQKEPTEGQAWDIYDFFQKQSQSLIAKPRHLSDEWAIVGNPGWYDYEYADLEKYDLDELAKRRLRFGDWNDKHYVNFGESDRTVSRKMKEQLEQDLKSVGDKKIILMTHVATHSQFVVPTPHRLYSYMNAFLGAKSYEELYKNKGYDIQYNIMGHVHFQQRYYSDQCLHMMACLGNRRHWLNKDNVKAELSNALLTFTI